MSIVRQPFSDLWNVKPSLSSYDWNQLLPWEMWSFRWRSGETPLSHWQILIYTWFAYLGTLVVIQMVMSKREAFQLKTATVIHNIFLSALSLVMFIGVVYGTLHIICAGGWWSAFCLSDARSTLAQGPLWYWLYVYFLSKFYELFDTILLALKKKPLQFLHVYHHIVVLAMVWSWLDQVVTISCSAAAANTFIHVIMYWYYVQTALGHQPWYKRYITQMQLMQFGISFLLTLPVFLGLTLGEMDGEYTIISSCTGVEALCFTMAANISFLVLFSRFYYSTYHIAVSDKKHTE